MATSFKLNFLYRGNFIFLHYGTRNNTICLPTDISWTKLNFNIKQTYFSFDIKHFVIEKSNTCIIQNLYLKQFYHAIISLQQSESINFVI